MTAEKIRDMNSDKNKSEAIRDFMNMTKRSWTWERMTEEERKRFDDLAADLNDENFDGHVRGSYKSRWTQMQMVYRAFLAGLGYTGGIWRPDAEDDYTPFC